MCNVLGGQSDIQKWKFAKGVYGDQYRERQVRRRHSIVSWDTRQSNSVHWVDNVVSKMRHLPRRPFVRGMGKDG